MANDDLLLIYFVSFVVQTALQGILFFTSSLFVYVTLCRRYRTPLVSNKFGLVGAALITGGATSYWGLSFAQLYRAIFHPGNQSPTVYLSDLRNPLFLTKIYLHFTFTAIADLLFVYRLYVVWQDRRCVVLPPLLAVAGYFSIATSAITWLAQAADNKNIYDIAYSPRVIVSGILTIWRVASDRLFLPAAHHRYSLNMYCTILISWRIWRAGRCAVRYGGPSLSQSFVIFIESAGFHLLFSVAAVVVYLVGSPVIFSLVDLATVIAGLAYMFINVRVALGIAHQGVPTEPSGMNFASGPLTQQETILDLELGDTEVVSHFKELPFFFRAHAAPEEGTQTDERTF
ncbi:hypothetical protein FB107DRAFT_277479 [Schizophyllum commune]